LGAPAGDLYLYITLAKHKIFVREGRDVTVEFPIPFAMAALGGVADAPLVEGGRLEVKIPRGVQPGSRLRVRGKGMGALGSGARGDMFLDLEVEVPTKLTARQEELLKQFDEESRNSGGGKSFFERIFG
jgi:molecular chaperone DnaJ